MFHYLLSFLGSIFHYGLLALGIILVAWCIVALIVPILMFIGELTIITMQATAKLFRKG